MPIARLAHENEQHHRPQIPAGLNSFPPSQPIFFISLLLPPPPLELTLHPFPIPRSHHHLLHISLHSQPARRHSPSLSLGQGGADQSYSIRHAHLRACASAPPRHCLAPSSCLGVVRRQAGGRGGDEGAERAEAAGGPPVVEQVVRRRGVPRGGSRRAAAGVRRRVPGLLRVRVPGDHAAVGGAGPGGGSRRVRGEGGGVRGAGGGWRRRGGEGGGGAAGVRVRRAGAVLVGGRELDGEHAGRRRARHRGRAEAARAVQPAGVRARRRDAAVAGAQPRRPHRVPRREPVLRVPPGGAAPGAGGLRRRLHHHRPRVPRPARRRPRRPRRRVPPRPEPPLLRLPPRHQRPPQPALRRLLGRHPRRRPPRVHGVVAGEDVGDIHGGGAGADAGGGGGDDGRAGARLRAGGGAGVLQGVPVRGEPGRRDQHAVAGALRRARRRRRRPPGRLLLRGRRGRPLVLIFTPYLFTHLLL